MKPLFYTIGDSFTRGVRTDEVNVTEKDKFHEYKGTLGSFGDWIFKDLSRRFNRHINLSTGEYDNDSIVQTCKLLRENLIKDDFVLIVMTNPSKGQEIDMTNKEVITLVTSQIQEIQEILDGYNYLITFAFSSLVPYWTSPRILRRKIKDASRIIEWTNPNNTLHDICSGTWLEEEEINPLMSEVMDESGDVSINHSIGFNDPNRFNPYHNLGRNFCKDNHPSTDGHELIANILKPYIIESLDS
jgi:hypothetical protein